MNSKLKVKISKDMSYLLRHNHENLKMDEKGFVDFDEFLVKLGEKYDVDKHFIKEIVIKAENGLKLSVVK